MNPMQAMKDPAAGVAPQLLQHLHLVSKHLYPTANNLSLETIVGYLMDAPKIMSDLKPVQWQFLDPPPADGHLMLVWQPLQYLGTDFASDGYVWADAEHTFKSEVRGYSLEMLLHRSGYQSGEPMASHCRKRYRLVAGSPGLPAPDPSLWIIHYSKASPRDHIPAASIPVQPQVHAFMQQRRILQAQGQITRKEFMLRDRASWPTIAPPTTLHGRGSSMQMLPRGHTRGPSMTLAPGEASLEEEEDVSRGDFLDFMTPREISRARYEQHHEWMEEILESPYAMRQIIPVGLGLGRKGELEALTSGFFESPSYPDTTTNPIPGKVGRMDGDQAADFRKKASQKIKDLEDELQAMKRKHARRIERLQKAATLSAAEKRLRTAGYADQQAQDTQTTEDIVEEVEKAWGKKVERVSNVKVVEKGGLDEKSMTNGLANGFVRNVISPTKSVFSPTVRQSSFGQSDGTLPYQSQQQPPQPLTTQSATQLPMQLSQPSASPAPSSGVNIKSPNQEATASPRPSAGGASAEDADQIPPVDDMDIDMDLTNPEDQDTSPEEGLTDNAWVMVDQDGDGHVETLSQTSAPVGDPPATDNELPTDTYDMSASARAIAEQNMEPEQPVELGGNETAEDSNTMNEENFDISDEFNDVDVDTAGDALADYGDEEDDLNLDTMDDSAFGEAFHPPDDTNTPMEDQDNT